MKKLLVVVDMQKDFIDGTLGTPEAQGIISNVAARIKEFRSESFTVVFTRDTHGENYLDTQEGKNLPIAHCIEGTDGWQINKNLEVGSSKIFNKNNFGSTELGSYVAENNFDEVMLVGLCTDICVISNAMIIKAFAGEVKVKVDSSACAGVTPKTHLQALESMKMCQVEVI